MENFSYHVPFYVVTNGVATQGYTSDLVGGQVGLFDRQTWSVATGSGNGKELFFSQGATGGKGFYGEPVTESHKSPTFLTKDVINIYKSLPAKLQNEEWIVGYDGSASSKSLEFVKGKKTSIDLYFHGEPIYRLFNGPKEFSVSYTAPMDCTSDCASDCDGTRQDPKPHAIQLVKYINNFIELQKLGVRAKLVEDTYSAATATKQKYTLVIFDAGDTVALTKVQAQYPGAKIARIKTEGVQSTYEITLAYGASAPADFVYDGSQLSLSSCTTCPAGYTTVAGKDVYFVNRPLAGTEDLTTSGAQQTYADVVGTSYKVTKTFNGATDVDPTTDQITSTAHGLLTGQKVTYSNGGGTTIVGLTNNTDYFIIKVDANNVKLATTFANATAGTPIDITADGVGAAHTLKSVIVATYLGNNGSVSTIKLDVSTSFAVVAILSDVVTLEYTQVATCQSPAGSVVSWVIGVTGVSGSRILKIKLKRPDCNASGDRVSDIQNALTGVSGVVGVSGVATVTTIAGTACFDEYTVSQTSDDFLTEDCLTSEVSFKFATPLPAIDGISWDEQPVVITTNAARKVGIRISAGYFDPKFGSCSFDPYDYYETMPLKMEVTGLIETGDNCAFAAAPTSTQTKIARFSRQSGEYVIREVIMKTEAYVKHAEQWDANPRMREAFDMQIQNMVDRNAFYTLWYVTYAASYNPTSRSGSKPKFTTVFAFKENDPKLIAFEANVINVVAQKAGIVPHINS